MTDQENTPEGLAGLVHLWIIQLNRITEGLAGMARLGEPALSRTGLQQPRWARWRGWLQDILVGYGYAPGRALAWLVAAFATGTLTTGDITPHRST